MPPRRYHIGNMTCPACAREVETAVSRLDGVDSAHVDFASNTLQLDGQVDYGKLKARVESLGKTLLSEPENIKKTENHQRSGIAGFADYLWRRGSTRLALGGGALLLMTLLLEARRLAPAGLINAAYLLSLALALKPIAVNGIRALRINREFNINMLMTIAALGAIILGEYLEAATVIFLFSIGEALEGYTSQRARDSLHSLAALKPLTANRIIGDKTETVPVEELRIDDRIRVLPGEKIPMDGAVLSGHSRVNQASITGESLPVAKSLGDEVFAGSINGEGALEIRVSRLSQDSAISRIIDLLQNAQSLRAPSQRLVDRFARFYTPAVVLAAIGVALIPPLFFGGPLGNTATDSGWLYRALSMLVIACPCALVISTPVTVISAIAAAARQGVLIKGGAHLEALARVKLMAFDKTGTLTAGRLRVTSTHTNHCAERQPCQPCDELISLAAAVEAQSTHPFAEAILASAQAHDLAYATAEQVEVLAGQGVQGSVDGRRGTIGSHSYFDSEFAHSSYLCAAARQIENGGQSAVMVHDGETVRGLIALADTPRAESRRVVKELREMGIQSVMLTGDNETVAQVIAEQIGLDSVCAELLPQDKVSAIENLQAQVQRVAMIGDGINDTPALAAASVGIAMGGAGTAQAMETADIVLMADSLNQLPPTIRRARLAYRLIQQNILLSFILKAVFLLLALTGSVTMMAAVLADVGMSLIVTLNGMRALKKGPRGGGKKDGYGAF